MHTDPPGASPNAVLVQALGWFDAGAGVVLATVVRSWSSAPMRPGSLWAMQQSGERVGAASGGLADDMLVSAARAALETGAPRQVTAEIDDVAAQQAGLPCGGRVEWRVEPLRDGEPGNVPSIRQVIQAQGERRGVVWCTRLSDALHMLVGAGDSADTELVAEALRAAAADSTRVVEVDAEPVLFQVFNAPLRLFIVGAGHIAQALVPAARLLGFEVTVIDPRPGFAQPGRFPGATCIVEAPALALRMASLDARSAVVTLSHDASIDDPALVKALHSRAFYVGALGSRKTHKARLKRLNDEAKLPDGVTARLHGPAGLPIGAIGPAEIAASIVAEVIAELRGQASRAADALRAAEVRSTLPPSAAS